MKYKEEVRPTEQSHPLRLRERKLFETVKVTPDYEETVCRKCGCEAEFEDCWSCGGEGCFDMHDDDPVNYAPEDTYYDCDECYGEGGWLVCPYCTKQARKADKSQVKED